MPTGLLSGALMGLLAVVSALSLLIVGNRLVRRHRQRRRERIAAPVRGLLLQLLCAEEDEQSELLHRLAETDRRTWAALEPTLTALLGKVAGGARTALVRLYELRGAAVDAVADLSSRSAVRRGAPRRCSVNCATVPLPRRCAVCWPIATPRSAWPPHARWAGAGDRGPFRTSSRPSTDRERCRPPRSPGLWSPWDWMYSGVSPRDWNIRSRSPEP